jgi:hypothetical protein
VRILLPLLANLALLWVILNQAAGLTTDSVLLFMQFGGDIGWALLISATNALGWGVILRPMLTRPDRRIPRCGHLRRGGGDKRMRRRDWDQGRDTRVRFSLSTQC